MDEFIAVAETLLRNSGQAKKKVTEATTITKGSLTLNLPQNKAYVGGSDVGLTQKEFAVLLMLVQNEGKEITDKRLYESIWNAPMNNDSNAIRIHVSRLKKKLNTDNKEDFDIVALYGGGFVFTTK